jgi:hypothetical protein
MAALKRSIGACLAISLVLLTSVWLGHTLEYMRLWPGGAKGQQLLSVHVYMLPLAIVLQAMAVLAVATFLRLWRAIGLRAERAEAMLAGAWRNAYLTLPAEPIRTGTVLGGRRLWLLLAPVELTLYLLQENIEAAHAGLSAPGIGAITGVHWPAAFVHLAVLLILCTFLAGALQLLAERTHNVEQVERLARLVARRHHRHDAPSAPVPVWLAPPIHIFGRHLWRRPPPPRPLSA